MLTNTTVQDISAIDVVIEQGSELVQEQCKRNKDMIQGKPLLRFNSSLVPVLMNAVAEYGTDQWETISVKVFGSKVTPEYLKHHYLRLEQKRKTWTDQQLEQLINAVSDVCDKSQHRVESDPVISTVTTSRARIDSVLDESHWDQIAKSLPGEHTAIECRERWIRMKIGRGGQRRIDSIAGDTCENNPKEINTSDSSEKQSKSKATKSTTESYTRWTAEQTHRLEAIVNSARERSDWKHNGWENVAELMNHEFTKAQCKARWVRLEREIKDRNISTGPWSREEVQDLIKGINEFGPNWIKIREKWVQGRTASFCQGKWSRLKTRLNLEMTIRRCSWSRVCKEIYGDEMGEILGRLPERWPTICDMPVKKNVI
ncbi:hypothetical protein BGZ46_010126 [Entomortierella lignicola]|nr:hypothetical protein BGZ46_010126 [Entomortierella lignicola]